MKLVSVTPTIHWVMGVILFVPTTTLCGLFLTNTTHILLLFYGFCSSQFIHFCHDTTIHIGYFVAEAVTQMDGVI